MTQEFLALIGILAFLLLLYVLTIVYEQHQRKVLRRTRIVKRRAPSRVFGDEVWGHRNSRMSN